MCVLRNDLNTSLTAMRSSFWATRVKTEFMLRQHTVFSQMEKTSVVVMHSSEYSFKSFLRAFWNGFRFVEVIGLTSCPCCQVKERDRFNKKPTIFILLSKLYNISARLPRSEQRGGEKRGQTPPGLLRRQPHASIRKLESTPAPTGYVETLTPASRPHKRRRLKHMQGNNPYAYVCTDTYNVNRATRVHHPECTMPMQYHG